MTDDDTTADEMSPEREQHSAGTADEQQVDWTEVPTDPDPHQNLGYEHSQWEEIPVSDDDQVIFLPSDEEEIADDAFIVSGTGSVCDLVTRR